MVIGAGVVGLAVAARLAEKHTVIQIESYAKFGQETSSRNSEVVHSGIYYPLGSKKTAWCIEGRKKLYEFCEKYSVPVARTGKFVVSTSKEEEAYLDKLAGHCREVGVPHERCTRDTIQAKEPTIVVTSGVYLPETGIVDSHVYMAVLEKQLAEAGGMLAYRHKWLGSNPANNRWISTIQTPDGTLEVESRWVINAAGLAAAEISNQVLGGAKFEHRYCRGRYFGLTGKYQNHFKHLVYPVPPKDGLGIHITIDMAGYARLGPDVDWCHDIKAYHALAPAYDCDWETLRPTFAKAAQRYCPMIQESELAPTQIGVRPKLFISGTAHPDFLIENHSGFVHCLGIESPGLTASPAIALEVARLVN